MKKIITTVICALLVCAMLVPAVSAEIIPIDYKKYVATTSVGKEFSCTTTIKAPEGWTYFEAEVDEENSTVLQHGLDFFVSGSGVMIFGEPTRPGVATLALTLKTEGEEPVPYEINVAIDPVKVEAKDEFYAEVKDIVSEEFVFEDYGIFLINDWGLNSAKTKITSDDMGLRYILSDTKLIVEGKAKKAGKADIHLVFNIANGESTLDIKVTVGDPVPMEPEDPVTPEQPTDPTPAFTFKFTDVKTTDWFYNDVFTAAKMGLIDGKTVTQFAPAANMTYAEAIKLAACINQRYTTGKVTLENGSKNWYDTYVEYAKAHGIPTDYADMNASITREDFVHVFYHALPAENYKSINKIGAVPDVDVDAPLYSEILTFYSAGILTGSDAKGTFNPTNNIKRSEVAAIITRMMDSGARIKK